MTGCSPADMVRASFCVADSGIGVEAVRATRVTNKCYLDSKLSHPANGPYTLVISVSSAAAPEDGLLLGGSP